MLHVKFTLSYYCFFNIVASHNFRGGRDIRKRLLAGQIMVSITAADTHLPPLPPIPDSPYSQQARMF